MLHIIANPASQSGSGQKKVQTFLRHLEHQALPAVIHNTNHPGHAQEIAASLSLSAEDTLIIAGGDGSIDEVINGLPIPCNVGIALLPSGSGNDFARGLKISHNPIVLAEKLLTNTQRFAIDLGTVSLHHTESQPHRFAVTCGFGMDAAICEKLETGKLKSICNRLHIGKLSYIIVGVLELLQTGKKKRASMKLTLDHDRCFTYRDVAFVSVHNLPYEGGGFPFCPKADPRDGFLDVCVIRVPCRLLLIPILLASLIAGNHTHFHPYVSTFRCHTIKVESDRPLTFHTDGEYTPSQIGFTASVLPNALHYLGE